MHNLPNPVNIIFWYFIQEMKIYESKKNIRLSLVSASSLEKQLKTSKNYYIQLFLVTWLLKSGRVEVCFPALILNETRQEETGHHFPNWQYREKTTFSGPVALENPGKIREINGTGRGYSLPFGKVSSSTEFRDSSWKTTIFF